jgi:hypothetical protein
MRRHAFNLSWLAEGSEPVMPHFAHPPVFSGLLTYPVNGGEISSHHLDLLCEHDHVLIVGSDRTFESYARTSLTNSIEDFLEGVMAQFPWVDNVHWDFLERDSRGGWNAVALAEEVDRKGRRVRYCHPQWMPIDATSIERLLTVPVLRPAPTARFRVAPDGVSNHEYANSTQH